MVKIFDIYSNLINESNGNIGFLKYDELKKWYDEEKEKNERILDYKSYTIKSKQAFKKFNQAYYKLYREYGDSIYGFGGDINARYLYHFTDLKALEDIISENTLIGSFGEGISFTSYANLYKHNFVFQHPSQDYEGRTHRNTPVRLKFDYNKMKNSGLKFVAGDEDIGTYYGEFEIRLPKLELTHIDNYLLEVAIFKSKTKDFKESDFIKLKEKLNNKGVKLIFI